jgi:acyl homoserine lactone synthase
MNEIVITQENEARTNPLVNEVFRLRHETFIDRLEWDIESIDGLERDRFDDMQPYHIAVKTFGGCVDGCWRALPTTGEYMLKDVFPELLQGEVAPRLNDVWEISRFAVRKGSSSSTYGYMSAITIDLVRSFYEFALQKNIRAYVTVTTVACERLLRQLGVSCRRLGEANVLQVGKERSVALWINVDNKLAIRTH